MHWDQLHRQLDSLQAEELAERSSTSSSLSGQDLSNKARDWNFALGGPAGDTSIDGLAAELEEFVTASAQIEREVLSMEATASDRNRLVEVSVNASGIVQRTNVLDKGRSRSPEELANAFTDASQEAAAQVHAKAAEAWAPLRGTMAELDAALPIGKVSSPTADFLSAAQSRSDSLFPSPRNQHADEEK